MSDKDFFEFLRGYFSKSVTDREATLNNTIINRINDLELKVNAFNIMKSYARNNGWSDDWTIEFWNMKDKEIDTICKALTKKPIPLASPKE